MQTVTGHTSIVEEGLDFLRVEVARNGCAATPLPRALGQTRRCKDEQRHPKSPDGDQTGQVKKMARLLSGHRNFLDMKKEEAIRSQTPDGHPERLPHESGPQEANRVLCRARINDSYPTLIAVGLVHQTLECFSTLIAAHVLDKGIQQQGKGVRHAP